MYLIEFLHQTTTVVQIFGNPGGCILLNFYIKPQHAVELPNRTKCCILLNFYIKPQLEARVLSWLARCILLNFYIKPQPRAVFALILWLLCPVSRLKKTGLNSAEVDLMSFFVFQRTNIAKYFRKTPTAGAYRVWRVRFSPRNSEYRRTVCPLRPGCSYIPMAASNALPD